MPVLNTVGNSVMVLGNGRSEADTYDTYKKPVRFYDSPDPAVANRVTILNEGTDYYVYVNPFNKSGANWYSYPDDSPRFTNGRYWELRYIEGSISGTPVFATTESTLLAAEPDGSLYDGIKTRRYIYFDEDNYNNSTYTSTTKTYVEAVYDPDSRTDNYVFANHVFRVHEDFWEEDDVLVVPLIYDGEYIPTRATYIGSDVYSDDAVAYIRSATGTYPSEALTPPPSSYYDDTVDVTFGGFYTVGGTDSATYGTRSATSNSGATWPFYSNRTSKVYCMIYPKLVLEACGLVANDVIRALDFAWYRYPGLENYHDIGSQLRIWNTPAVNFDNVSIGDNFVNSTPSVTSGTTKKHVFSIDPTTRYYGLFNTEGGFTYSTSLSINNPSWAGFVFGGEEYSQTGSTLDTSFTWDGTSSICVQYSTKVGKSKSNRSYPYGVSLLWYPPGESVYTGHYYVISYTATSYSSTNPYDTALNTSANVNGRDYRLQYVRFYRE